MSGTNQTVQQMVVVEQPAMKDNQNASRVALFNGDGTPAGVGTGGGGASTVEVVTGNEIRPSGTIVFWVGGTTKPVNMGAKDVWFAAGEPADTTAPSVPSNLFATGITSTAFTLTWTASTDNTAVDHYEVRLNGGTPIVASSPKSFTGLSAATLYNVEVRAFDAANNSSAWSTILPVTTSAAAGGLSVFGNGSPGTFSLFSDGGGDLTVLNRFYATRPLTVLGVRLWTPANMGSTDLNKDVTFYAFPGDWAGSAINTMPSNPTQTKVFTDPRVAGTWTEVLFDTPISIQAINSAINGNDFIGVGYKVAGGNDYIHRDPGLPDPIQSIADPTVYLAEGAFSRGSNTLAGGVNAHYGLDILFQGV